MLGKLLGEARLVTLTGVGATRKTRLTVEFADGGCGWLIWPGFPTPTWWGRRLGLEPRTHGLKEDRWGAETVLPARMPHADARRAHIAQGYGLYSSHESSHGIPRRARRIRHSK